MRRSWFAAVAAVFVLGMIAARWDASTGLSCLLRFPSRLPMPRIPALAQVPVATVSGSGYDGQYYGMLAVSPDLRDPAVRRAFDLPAYRARRILLPITAHVLGGGNPWLTLQVYALENAVIWLALGWLILREVEPFSAGQAAGVWFGCMLGIGSLDCVRMALADLAPVLLLAAGVALVRSGRPRGALAALAFAGLARETSLLGGALLCEPGKDRAWASSLARLGLAAAPIVLWSVWLGLNVPGDGAPIHGNLGWPPLPFIRSCATCLRHLAGGDFGSRWLFGLLGGAGLAYQSLYLILRPRWSEPWWRVGVGFAALFWVLGDEVWHGYWAVARVVLPMTFAFNLLVPRDRWFWARIGAANLALVLHGVWRLLP
jgi:hypothetical protein